MFAIPLRSLTRSAELKNHAGGQDRGDEFRRDLGDRKSLSE
jgi:hypothetical protein